MNQGGNSQKNIIRISAPGMLVVDGRTHRIFNRDQLDEALLFLLNTPGLNSGNTVLQLNVTPKEFREIFDNSARRRIKESSPIHLTKSSGRSQPPTESEVRGEQIHHHVSPIASNQE